MSFRPGCELGAGPDEPPPPFPANITAPVAPAATAPASAPPLPPPIASAAGGINRNNAGNARIATTSNDNPDTTPARSVDEPITGLMPHLSEFRRMCTCPTESIPR